MHIFKVGAYVKLAKLWERDANKAIPMHRQYFISRCQEKKNTELVDVYIDITGKKHIYHRKAMIRLLSDCKDGRVNTVVSQTRAYLAANHDEFCFLVHYLFNLSTYIDIITEDREYNINTVSDQDDQRASLEKMADALIKLKPSKYREWLQEVELAIQKQSSQSLAHLAFSSEKSDDKAKKE